MSLEADRNMLKERFENLKNMYAGVEDFEKRQKNIKEQIVKTNPKVLGAPSNEVEELAFLECIEKGMQEFNVFYPKRLLYMFHTSLKSASLSPLSVLSGVSGTGKSELPKLYAHFGGLNFLSIAVQPTWDSPESLMGYFNAIENKFDATEFLRFFIQTTLSNDEYLKAETFNSWINKEGNLKGKLERKYKKLTEEINEHLSACGRSIGHRVWQSMSAYMHNHPLVLHAF